MTENEFEKAFELQKKMDLAQIIIRAMEKYLGDLQDEYNRCFEKKVEKKNDINNAGKYTNYEYLKTICKHIQAYLVHDEDEGEIEVFPCEYMINYYTNREMNYCPDELQPDIEDYCLKCPYRNKNMGEHFEIDPEKMK